MNIKPINVGLLGIGTVGGGTFTVFQRNAEEIARRAGRPSRSPAAHVASPMMLFQWLPIPKWTSLSN
jgi:homoserine dehydrogenase